MLSKHELLSELVGTRISIGRHSGTGGYYLSLATDPHDFATIVEVGEDLILVKHHWRHQNTGNVIEEFIAIDRLFNIIKTII